MIYKFKSQAEADVLMQKLNGDQMLTIVGKTPSPQGIITVEQIPAAIAALEASVAAHEAAQARAQQNLPPQVPVEGNSILLRQRVAPFIDLLRTSLEAGKDVVWGV